MSQLVRNLNEVIPQRALNLVEYMWPLIWDKDEPCIQVDSRGRKYAFYKGQRVIYVKQLETILSGFNYKVTLCAGGTGGGKSVSLMWFMLLYGICIGMNGFPGARLVIFAESLKTVISRQFDLLARHVPRFLGHTRGGAGGMINEFVLEDEYGGAVIEYQSTDNFDTKQKGIEYAAIGVEESTNQTKDFFDFIVTRARYTYNAIPLEHVPIVMVTNPIGIGVGWHLSELVDPWDPESGEGRKPPMWVTDVRGKKTWFKGYNVIESFAMDNPSQSDDYIRSLSMMTGAAYDLNVLGSWKIFQGSFFNLEMQVHSFSRFMQIPLWWNRFLACDYAMGHTGCAYAGAMDPHGNLWVFKGFEEKGLTPAAFKKRMNEVFRESDGTPMKFVLQVADPSMFPKKNGEGAKESAAAIFNQLDEDGQYQFYPAENARILGWQGVKSMLDYAATVKVEPGSFVKTITPTRMPRLRFADNLVHLFRSFQIVRTDPNNSEDCIKTKGDYGPGLGDDACDTVRYMVQAAFFNRYKTPDSEGRAIVKKKRTLKKGWG